MESKMSLKCIFRISKLGAGGAERVFISIADYLKAVSYTHLDVYKRQRLVIYAIWGSTIFRAKLLVKKYIK